MGGDYFMVELAQSKSNLNTYRSYHVKPPLYHEEAMHNLPLIF